MDITTKRALTVGALAVAAFSSLMLHSNYMASAYRADQILSGENFSQVVDKGEVDRDNCAFGDFKTFQTKSTRYLSRNFEAKAPNGREVAGIICAKGSEVRVHMHTLDAPVMQQTLTF